MSDAVALVDCNDFYVYRRHGRDTVCRGLPRTPDGRWPTNSLMRSPGYTTRLKDVLRVA